MKRTLIAAVVLLAAIASAAGYQRASHWKPYTYPGTFLKADLARPDALIRTASLARLPHDILKVPLARDVLTEDLVFYYEHHEDRLGLEGAVRRIAYEHELGWGDRVVQAALDEPAQVALWRDGRGALRHFAIVLRRNALASVLQEAGTVALKDRQLTRAGTLATRGGEAAVLALQVNPRRTLLLIARGERLVVLSDPGLLFNDKREMNAGAAAAVASWIDDADALARVFALEPAPAATHTLVVGVPTLALGYGAFLGRVEAVRFDFGTQWSTSVRMAANDRGAWGDAALWRAVPANPAACVALPVDWSAARRVLDEADAKPALPAQALAALDGSALACWYRSSGLYAPIFVVKLAHGLREREHVLQALAAWAIAKPVQRAGSTMAWRGEAPEGLEGPTLAAAGDYVVFSPDGALADLALETVARRMPSVADQVPAAPATFALLTPRVLSGMFQDEALGALSGPGDAALRAAAEAQLPPRMKALATYPPYRLEVAGRPAASGWVRVEWHSGGKP
jgi:uncharacterized protein YfaA (DUF2138 family)